jgi:Eco57I restriction-modification methylase
VSAANGTYTGIQVAGQLLAPDLLRRIGMADRELPGNRPEDYHLAAGERLGEAASRRWEYLLGAYRAFRDRLDRLPETDPATSETRERWLLVLLSELGFGRIPYVRGGLTAGERSYPVSHLWENVPIHLLGWHADLDRRTGGGETGRAPQSMLQEFLNVSEAHLWGVLSNGRVLRIMRDSAALVGSAYVEFDLEAIFDGELYSDFTLLFALVHSSRFEPLAREDGAAPSAADCWLERWRDLGIKEGTRARDRLRDGVEQALNLLGTGFLAANPSLQESLARGERDGGVSKDDLHHELLRLAYQLVFLFVAEDRGVLFDPEVSAEAAHRYDLYFSTRRLRQIAAHRAGDRHTDLWRTLVVVLDALGADGGLPEIGLPALGGLYFRAGTPNGDHGPAPDLLRDCELRNADLLEAVRHLATFRDKRRYLQNVDFRHLGAEELGSVYESLLELVPATEPGPRFVLRIVSGHERKTTGSYYTPTPLVETLLDSALDPLIDEAAASNVPDDLLKITVCDPACGSGHFLIAAARRIAKRYTAMHYGDDEPTPGHVQQAMRKVVARCIHGVDINPLAAELAKVSLWLESLEPGRPLEFLDAHIKVGNALLGTTPKLLEAGLPDTAFKPIEGDDSKIAASLRRQNEKERGEQLSLFDEPVVRVGNADLAAQIGRLAALPTRSLADIRLQARRYRELEHSPELRDRKRIADAWCAAFVWRKHAMAPAAITNETLRRLDQGYSLSREVGEELDRLSERYRFFHWHLEFPDIFRIQDDARPDHNPDTGWQGGFTCVVGNPPWERVKLQEKEFFAARRPEIANAANAATRKKLITLLCDSNEPEDRVLCAEFQDELRTSAGWSHLLRDSSRYPLTGQGDVNTYAVFAETARTLLALTGRSGFVLPTGIATDATTAPFFRDIIEHNHLDSLLDFVTNPRIWQEIGHGRQRFALLVITGRGLTVDQAEFWTFAKHPDELPSRGKRIRVTSRDLLLANPNTGTAPLFASQRDADITLGIYRRAPILWRDKPDDNTWSLSFLRMFDMANDSGLFRTRDALAAEGWELHGNVFAKGADRMLPLYEAKMIHHFDHRLGSYDKRRKGSQDSELPRLTPDEKKDPMRVPIPLYWVSEVEVNSKLKDRWSKDWLFGWRDICRSSDERTMICSTLPRFAVGHKLPLVLCSKDGFLLLALWSCFVFDYIARQKFAGTSMSYFILKQLPVPRPDIFSGRIEWCAASLREWSSDRILELSFTAWDMDWFAKELGDHGAPFVWNEDRRFKMRAELDAAFFHLYGVARDDVDYIMDSFHAFRNNDPERFTRTKALILDIYDAMAVAMETGEPYQTILDPPPGEGPRNPARIVGPAR